MSSTANDNRGSPEKNDLRSCSLKCVNRLCDDGKNLQPVIRIACSYYHVKYKSKKKVCSTCLEKCLRHYKLMEKKMLNGECVMDTHFPIYESYEVLSSSSEEEINSLDEDLKNALSVTVSDSLNRMSNVVSKQIELCKNHLNEKLYANVLNEANEVDELNRKTAKQVLLLRNLLHDPYRPKSTNAETIELEEFKIPIQDKDTIKNDNNTCIKNKDIIYQKTDSMDSEPVTVDKVFCTTHPPDLPKEGSLVYSPILDGTLIYAAKGSLLEPWITCRMHLRNGTDIVDVYDGNTSKQLPRTHIAYYCNSDVQYPVGCRVISKYSKNHNSEDEFYAGVVAEPPTGLNHFRYLVFFDNGEVRYCHHESIRLIVHKPQQVWNCVHGDIKEYIKKYLEAYPDRHMVKLTQQHNIKAFFEDHWLMAKVIEVDASLVKLRFPTKEEWLYRGSPRLWNIYEKQSQSEKGIRSRQSGLAYLNKPFVEFSSIKEKQPVSNPIVKCVARKSTSKCLAITSQIDEITEDKAQEVDFETIKLTLPQNCMSPKKFVPHTCNPSCVNWTKYDYTKTKFLSVLDIPLYFGFIRYLAHFNENKQKCVYYRTPCGRMTRSIKEMYDYLVDTKSKMTIDFFDFNSWVKPLAQFNVYNPIKSIFDISMNKEFKRVTCVNNVNFEMPPPMVYLTSRQAMQGVNINLETQFLCGCDCTDNCENKTKCACWRMTAEGQSALPDLYKNPIYLGYNYRRLPDRVLTGIYECNSTCKCSGTCSNRVVQNKLSNKLQLFRTEKKGWGVRCLHDLPQGSFICNYVGNLLTETDANERGKNYGDEYLAELDYIEVSENIKEDYESDIPSNDEDCDRQENANDSNISGSSDEDFQCTSKINTRDNVKVDSKNIASRLRKRKVQKNKEKKISSSKKERSNIKFNQHTSKSVREYFGKDECVYIMDAKTSGNIARYINHSCDPNMFVQNVFVDTHDLRFPWISFFALHYIPAGTELTWDYSYDVGSVPGKVMKCHCESNICRGRLL